MDIAKAKKTRATKHRPKAIDLFCGAGGMSLGFEQAGFDIVLAVDSDGHHVAVHKRNFPTHPTLCTSVTDLSSRSIFAEIGGKQEIDLVFGGPPCQGFSTMGLRDEQDSRNSLVDHFARLIAEIQPKAFVMENVPGMASGKTKPVLDRLISNLEKAGYAIAKPVQVLDASHFGVPQKRKRLFVIGVRSDVGSTPTYPTGPLSGQPERPTVWEAIGDLPDVERIDALFTEDVTSYDKEAVSMYAKVARGELADATDFSYPRKWDGLCTGCMRIRHMPKAVELYESTAPGSVVPGHKLPRLNPNGLCSTLRAGSDSTHGSYTAPRPIHPVRPRCITAREAARLHGYPDWFAFYPTKWHAYRQIGNSVCPQVARAVGFAVLAALGIKPQKPRVQLALASAFHLPDERPRTLKRIPHVDNYPQVIGHLFQKAYDSKAKKLIRPRFTFADVAEAIRATSANLPWTRADTFIQEIARSRNVLQILEPCLAHGFSIAALNGKYLGEFRPESEPGIITDRDTVDVRIADLHDAIALKGKLKIDFGDARTLIDLLDHAIVTPTLWDERVRFHVDDDDQTSRVLRYELLNGKGPKGGGIVTVFQARSLITKSRLRRMLLAPRQTEVLVVYPMTDEHVLTARFDLTDETTREIRRCVFRVPKLIKRKPRKD